MGERRILVIEDDRAIRRGVLDALAAAGFATLEADDFESAVQLALSTTIDLVLLDLILPGGDGLEVLRRIRDNRPGLPVIILTARGDEQDRVGGLRLGADDYVVKPFSVRELLARIEAVMRRSPGLAAAEQVRFPGGWADLSRRVVHCRGGPDSELSERETELLRYFAANAGRTVSREEILRNVWGISAAGIETRTIDMHVARLREKLRDDASCPRVLKTVWGQGYCFARDDRG